MEKEQGSSHMRETLFCRKSRCTPKQGLFGEELLLHQFAHILWEFFYLFTTFFLKIILIFHTISEALQDIAFWCCQARLNSSYTYSTFLVLMVIFFPFCYLLTFSPTPVDSEAPLMTWRCCSHHCTVVLPLSSMAGREGVAHSRFLSLTWSKGFCGTARGACALYTSLISCHY